MTLKERALQIAIGEIGKEEVPRGSNWGPDVKGYLASVGIGFPASWCMAFVYWCFNKAAAETGATNPLVKTGGVLSAYNKARKLYDVIVPEPGDIFIMDHGHGLGHTGIVERTNGRFFNTIEGNTNNNGSREGIAVERKIRDTKDKTIIGYLRYN